jgi:hypothetical protein
LAARRHELTRRAALIARPLQRRLPASPSPPAPPDVPSQNLRARFFRLRSLTATFYQLLRLYWRLVVMN